MTIHSLYVWRVVHYKPGADRQGQEQLDTSLGDVVHVQDMKNHLEMWRSHHFWIPKDGNILTNYKGYSRMYPTQFLTKK